MAVVPRCISEVEKPEGDVVELSGIPGLVVGAAEGPLLPGGGVGNSAGSSTLDAHAARRIKAAQTLVRVFTSRAYRIGAATLIPVAR